MTRKVTLLAAFAVAIAAPVATARVIMRPSIARSCPGGKTWDAVASCVKRFGTIKMERSKDDAKVFRVTPNEGQWGTEGIYIYAGTKQGWRMVGQYLDDNIRIVGFSEPTVGGKKIYRLDLLFAAIQEVSVSEVATRRGYVRRATSLYCGGVVSTCAQVITSCDVFVGAKLLETFRGTPRYTQNGILKLDGDRSRAGNECATDEDNVIELPGRAVEDPLF